LDIVTSKPLSRLRDINLEDRRLEYEGDGDESESFRTFATFGLLPAMRKFSGVEVPSRDPLLTLAWPSASHKSAVTDLDLQQSTIGPNSLQQLLGEISALRSFTYEHVHISHSHEEDTFSQIVQDVSIAQPA